MLCEKCQGQLKQNDENHFVCEKCGVACPEADDAYKELDEIVNDRGDYIVTLKNGFRTIWKNVFFFRKKKENQTEKKTSEDGSIEEDKYNNESKEERQGRIVKILESKNSIKYFTEAVSDRVKNESQSSLNLYTNFVEQNVTAEEEIINRVENIRRNNQLGISANNEIKIPEQQLKKQNEEDVSAIYDILDNQAQRKAQRHIRSFFDTVITILVIMNFLACVLMTENISEETKHALNAFGDVSVLIFLVEMSIRILLEPKDFFYKGNEMQKWNIFDLAVTLASSITIIPFLANYRGVILFRLFRLARIFRIFSRFDKLKFLLKTMFSVRFQIVWIGLLLLIVYGIYGVIGCLVFGDISPMYFGSFSDSVFTLFQTMTLENWETIARSIMDVMPFSWLYFVSFIVLSAFIIMNVVTGTIVDTMGDVSRSIKNDKEIQKKKFLECVKFCLSDDSKLSEGDEKYLEQKRKMLGLRKFQADQIKKSEIKNQTHSEREYYEFVKEKFEQHMSIDSKVRKSVCEDKNIDMERAREIEEDVYREINGGECYSENELEYQKFIKDLRILLDYKREELGITRKKQNQIEKEELIKNEII